MGAIVLLVVGYLIGLKCVLITQLMVLILFVAALTFMLAKELGELAAVFIVWLTVVLVIGMGVGDIVFYTAYYHGTTSISDFMGWFVKP